METYERQQALLKHILARFCDGNKAELARRLQKDPSYINRLFYPHTKAGAKGIGQEIMEACRKAFPLPIGFWDMAPDDVAGAMSDLPAKAGRSKTDQTPAELITRLAELLKPLSKTRRESVKPLLIELANDPDNADEMAALFEKIVAVPGSSKA